MTLASAIHLAIDCHEGQLDKQGVPYIFHLLRVLEAVRVVLPDDEIAQCAAVLHDALEDNRMYYLDTYWGDEIDAETHTLVKLLTRHKAAETYDEFIARIIASGDRRALIIKIADVKDNVGRMPKLFCPLRHYPHSDKCYTDDAWTPLRRRYTQALHRLEEALTSLFA